VIFKVHFRKWLQINLLQKTIYGRLSRRWYSCPEAARGFDIDLARARQVEGVILSEPGCA